MHYRVRSRLLLRRVISQSVWRGHRGLLISKRHGMDPHWSAIIGMNTLPPPKYPPDSEGLPHASIKIVCYLLPHWRIRTKMMEIPTKIVSKYRVTQHILAIGIPCYQLRSHLKEHLTHNHITIITYTYYRATCTQGLKLKQQNRSHNKVKHKQVLVDNGVRHSQLGNGKYRRKTDVNNF